jgi:hypothetical protein
MAVQCLVGPNSGYHFRYTQCNSSDRARERKYISARNDEIRGAWGVVIDAQWRHRGGPFPGSFYDVHACFCM